MLSQDHVSDVDGVRAILRALAEARDGPFYALFVDLTAVIKKPLPQLGFRIYRVADSDQAMLGLWVSAIRPDGPEVSWSLVLETPPGSLVVTASIEISDDEGTHEVFKRSAETAHLSEAPSLISRYAVEVCAERRFLAEDFDSGG